MRRLFTSLIAAFTMLIAANAQDLVVLHVGDTHSHLEPERSGQEQGLGGVIERAAYIDSVRASIGRGRVLLLHAGDFSQGTSYFTLLKGDVEIRLINDLGYDAITLGNHEFDNGIEELTRRLKKVKCTVLCANYDFSAFELGKYVKPYTIVRRGGMKIGIFGLLTDISTVVEKTTADRLPHLGDMESAKKWSDYLKNQRGCDVVIALTHLGLKGFKFSDELLARECGNIDYIVGGHSHTFIKEPVLVEDPQGKVVPIVHAACWGLKVGKLDIFKNVEN